MKGLAIILFGLGVLGAFIYLGDLVNDVSGGGVATAAAVGINPEAGGIIFKGKGKCSTCHSLGDEGSAVRCPNHLVMEPKFMEPIGVRAATRIPGMTAIEYMVESVYNPNAYLVEGYSKNVMKPINRPPIALNDDEITSAILFLLEESGIEVVEETKKAVMMAQNPYRGKSAAGPQEGPMIKFPKGDPEEGFDVFVEMKCFQCHFVEGANFDMSELTPEEIEGGVGPDLTDIGAIQTYEYLYESVVNPNAVILTDPSPDQKYKGEDGTSKMPNFLDFLTGQQLIDLVSYMKSIGNEEAEEDEDEEDEDEEDEDEDEDDEDEDDEDEDEDEDEDGDEGEENEDKVDKLGFLKKNDLNFLTLYSNSAGMRPLPLNKVGNAFNSTSCPIGA